ncbi:MAG: ABC transporter permease [Acidobacteriota bacterium]
MRRTLPPRQKTPLAWLSLIHDRRRLLASIAGVSFATLLMVIELGFLNAIYDSSTLIIDHLDADLLMVSRQKDDMNPTKPFPRRRLEQAKALDGIEAAYPLWFSRMANWSTRGRPEHDVLRLLAIDPADPVFALADINTQQHRLRTPDTALVDRRLRDSYGGLRAGVSGELEGRRVRVIGDFALGPDLQLNANMVVSDATFRRAFYDPRRGEDPLDQVEIGLLRTAGQIAPEALAHQLARALPDDVRLLTPSRLRREIHLFWTRNQPVGAVFGIGLAVGFFIGLTLCYQVLFTDIVDQLPQFATLKAIGYDNAYLRRLAVRRGLWLGLLALAIGLPLGLAAYHFLGRLTGLTFVLTLGRAALVGVASLSMCVAASVLATRRAIAADPAEVF